MRLAPAAPVTEAAAPQPVRRRGPVPRWWRDASATAGWLVLLVVTALWVSGGGIQEMTSLSGALMSVGRLTGLVASALLLIQVFLMARVPWVEQAWGQDELARTHRLVGFTSFTLMLGHIGLITLGYAAATSEGIVGTFVDLVLHEPGMLLAFAGTAALVMVVVTSVKKARRRLRYESWHLIHLYGYLGAGLALPHQLWTGTDFLASTTATVFWWSLYAACAGAVLVFRVGLPLWRSFRSPLRVLDVQGRGPGRHHRHRRWAGSAPDAGARRAVLPVAVPRRARLDPLQPLLGLRRPRRPDAAVHRRPRSATAPPGSPRCSPAPGCSSRARTAGCTAACARTARCSSWARASASPRCAPCSRSSTRHPATSPWCTGCRPGTRPCSVTSSPRSPRPAVPATCSSRDPACPTGRAGCPRRRDT